MKIGPFKFGRDEPDEEARAATESTPQPSKERGASGTINQDGYLQSDEYQPDLKFPLSVKTYDRMRRSDASVHEGLMHIFAPVLNAGADIESASDEPLDLEVAEFARQSFFEWPVDPWLQLLRQVLGYLTFGHQVFETVEQIVEAELSWTDPTTGEMQTAPHRQFVTWRRWAQRKPETITKWNVKDGELVSITQQVFADNGYEEPTIDAAQLVVFTNQREGDDFRGISVLRTAYKAWWLKETIEKVMGVGIERHGPGVPVAYVPTSLKNDDATLDRIENMLKGLRAGAFSYLVFPGPKGEATAGQGEGGFFFEIVSPSGGVPDFSKPLEYLRGEIKGNVLARFAELGHGSTGARATGDVQSEVWYDALHASARYIEEVCSAALRRLIDKNYRVERYPRLVFQDIESRSLTEFADSVSKLVVSGALLPDTSLRRAVRKTSDLPDEDDPTDGEEPPNPQPDEPIEDDPTAD